jgi:hypothetical protein
LLDTVLAHDTLERLNDELSSLTGIQGFFPSREALREFRHTLGVSKADLPIQREWGDFQTPPALAARVCQHLNDAHIAPRIIIEPTYGLGNFVLAAIKSFPTVELVYGVEIQEKYEWHLKTALLVEALQGLRLPAKIELHQDDIFTHHFPDRLLNAQDILIIGNPPWVTNAELGALSGKNLPTKKNIKSLNGLDAITGKSNFDLGEFILLRLMELFGNRRGTLAMLCKNAVIKNIIELLPRRGFAVSNIRALKIDASREFGAAVEASLLVMEMGATSCAFTCQVATLEHPHPVTSTFGWIHNKFVSDVKTYEMNADLDGKSPLVWRHGLKHDCVRIMELVAQEDNWIVTAHGFLIAPEYLALNTRIDVIKPDIALPDMSFNAEL